MVIQPLEIKIEHEAFYKTTSVTLSQITLFVGKNGSGKSLLLNLCLEQIKKDIVDPNYLSALVINDEKRIKKQLGVFENIQYTPKINGQHGWSNYRYADKMNIVIAIINDIFKRKIVIKNIDYGPDKAYYQKIDGQLVEIKNDGTGISTILVIFENFFNPENHNVIFVEELTMGLHPSAIPKVIDALLRLSEKFETRIIATTQDLCCLLYFLSIINNASIAIYETVELETNEKIQLWVTPIEKDSTTSRLKEYLGEFADIKYLKILEELGK